MKVALALCAMALGCELMRTDGLEPPFFEVVIPSAEEEADPSCTVAHAALATSRASADASAASTRMRTINVMRVKGTTVL